MDDRKCDLLHEVLNRLTVIVGQCELIQETACNQDTPCKKEANRRLQMIRTSANQMARLILKHQCTVEHRSDNSLIDAAPLRNPPHNVVGVRTFADFRRWLNAE
jgi:hypothetical protein